MLRVHAVYAEPDGPDDAGPAVAGAIHELGEWLAAREIAVERVPPAWKDALR